MTIRHAHALAISRRFLLVEDVDLIQEAVRTLPQDRSVLVVDLGAGSGTTALSVFDVRPENVRVLTVDHDPVAMDSTRQCMTNAEYVQNWFGFLTESDDTLPAQALFAGPYDMLMVDAGHEYEEVRRDLAAWLPLVREGGIVWCHDFTESYPGVIAAVDEAVADGRLVFVKAAGWGWLGLRGKTP